MTDGPGRDRRDDEEAERRFYHPDEETSLSETVLRAIEAYEGIDAARSEFRLFDAVDPDALDELFREGAGTGVVVEFTVDDLRVTLLGDDGVDVWVSGTDPR